MVWLRRDIATRQHDILAKLIPVIQQNMAESERMLCSAKNALTVRQSGGACKGRLRRKGIF